MRSFGQDRQQEGDGFDGEVQTQQGRLECGHPIAWHKGWYTPPDNGEQRYKHQIMHQGDESQGEDHYKSPHKRKVQECRASGGAVEEPGDVLEEGKDVDKGGKKV